MKILQAYKISKKISKETIYSKWTIFYGFLCFKSGFPYYYSGVELSDYMMIKTIKTAIFFSLRFHYGLRDSILLLLNLAYNLDVKLVRYGFVDMDKISPIEKFNKLIFISENNVRDSDT